MGARKDNLQHIQYLLGSAQRISSNLLKSGILDFGQQMDRGLSGERVILDKAKR